MNNESMIQNFKKHEKDTGSVEVQVVRLTEDIQQLTKHFQSFPKDANSKRGLSKKIGRRDRFLKYLKNKNEKAYTELIDRLNIRG